MPAPTLPLRRHPHPSPLATLGFHHVGFVSGDPVRTLRFYGELLGLTSLDPDRIRVLHPADPEGDAAAGGHHPGLLFGDAEGTPGTLVAFRVAPGLHRGRWGVGGIHHLALSVANRNALLRWKRRLSDAGFPATGPIDRGYFTSLYFQDPDGHVLELATEGPGYAIDERRPLESGTSRLPPSGCGDIGMRRPSRPRSIRSPYPTSRRR
jgi:glyoxalase family protein